MHIQQQRTIKVLENMIQLCKDAYDYAEQFSEFLDESLDDMKGDDAFGTEGQCDPRGDFRDGEYSMYHVEGIDE